MTRFPIPSVALALLLLAAALAPAGVAAAADMEDVPQAELEAKLEAFRTRLHEAVEDYEAAHGNWTSAETASNRSAARDGMEAAGREVGAAFLEFERGHGNASSLNAWMQGHMPPRFYQALERHVVLLRALMVQAGEGEASVASVEEVRGQWSLVDRALDRAASCMPDGCRGALVGTVAQAFVVLLREGFEAILIVGAMVAYLHKSDRPEKVRHVAVGVGLGVAASLVAWFALRWVFGAAQPGSMEQTLLEGTSMLLAAAVLFYVGFWLLSKVETDRWRAYLDGKVQDSLASDRAWVLGVIGFLAVFREGVETALFLQALSLQSGGATGEILLGLGLASVLLVGIYYLVHHVGVRVPLRPFFLGTSVLLYLLAVRFAGMGVFELQEGSLLSVTALPAVATWLDAHPLVGVLAQDVMGFAPTAEVALTQGILILVLAGGATWSLAIEPRTRDAVEA